MVQLNSCCLQIQTQKPPASQPWAKTSIRAPCPVSASSVLSGFCLLSLGIFPRCLFRDIAHIYWAPAYRLQRTLRTGALVPMSHLQAPSPLSLLGTCPPPKRLSSPTDLIKLTNPFHSGHPSLSLTRRVFKVETSRCATLV